MIKPERKIKILNMNPDINKESLGTDKGILSMVNYLSNEWKQ